MNKYKPYKFTKKLKLPRSLNNEDIAEIIEYVHGNPSLLGRYSCDEVTLSHEDQTYDSSNWERLVGKEGDLEITVTSKIIKGDSSLFRLTMQNLHWIHAEDCAEDLRLYIEETVDANTC